VDSPFWVSELDLQGSGIMQGPHAARVKEIHQRLYRNTKQKMKKQRERRAAVRDRELEHALVDKLPMPSPFPTEFLQPGVGYKKSELYKKLSKADQASIPAVRKAHFGKLFYTRTKSRPPLHPFSL
jgi:hypothetical protein